MYVHLKDRQYYENLYDHLTVESARRDIIYYDNFLAKFSEKDLTHPGNVGLINMFYLQVVGNELIDRYEHRDEKISEWMARDQAKDIQISEARLSKEPDCQHCHKQGLRLIDKSFMRREDNSDSEDVLFILKCPHCEKNSAFWKDGVVWKPKLDLCPKCSTEMTNSTKRTKASITFTYACPNCQHTYKDKIDLRERKETPDPNFEKDRIHYGLLNKEFREHLFEIKRVFEGLAELGKQMQEQKDNKHIYDAMKEIKKPKIAELPTLLTPALKKAGYTEVTLDKPEIGKDVFVGFSCLDTQSDRNDRDSRKALEKVVKETLEDTNWRLMSEGIRYRLGYLSGRVRAYERDEDIRELVMKTKKLREKQSKPRKKRDTRDNEWSIEGENGERIIL